MDIVEEVYSLVEHLPAGERYGLRNQITRAAVSIPSNIAVGSGRNSDREFNQYLGNAKGMVFELETQLEVCDRLEIIEKEKVSEIKSTRDEIGKMISSFQASLCLTSSV